MCRKFLGLKCVLIAFETTNFLKYTLCFFFYTFNVFLCEDVNPSSLKGLRVNMPGL